jgi:eukaryotic-like serine/threonine-protein kinase
MIDLPERLAAALSDRYTIERELGKGGMATVYLADDIKHSRRVAIKVLQPELAAVVGAERFLAEIKTTANLQHPHILPLFDSGEVEGLLYYVMPYVEGETLDAKLERERQLPIEEAVGIATAIANALDYAHRNGVIHRDIKPANVLLHDGQPVVADFGIALAVGAAGGTRLTETGLSVGTPYYMSPEQATGDQHVGPQSDIYALGAILYEMLVGEPPFTGATAQAVLGQILQGKPVSAIEKRASVPVNIDAVIRKSLEKIPADRFSTGQDMGRALTDPGFRLAGDLPLASGSGARARGGPIMAAIAVIAVMFGVFGWLRPEAPLAVSRYELNPPNVDELDGMNLRFDLSPDGAWMVFAGSLGEDDTSRLWIKQRERLDWTPVPGSEGARGPRVSPDGTRIAFFNPDDIGEGTFVIPVTGGGPIRISNEAKYPTWIDEEVVGLASLARAATGLIEEVSATGGAPREIWNSTTLTVASPPSALPDGRGLLFSACAMCPLDRAIFVLDAETGEAHNLGQGISSALLKDGTLLITRIDGTVWAGTLNPDRMELEAPPVPVLQGVATTEVQSGLVASGDGTLLLVLGPRAGPGVMTQRYEAVWVSRATGDQTVIVEGWQFQLSANFGLALSPDENFLAVGLQSAEGDDIWVRELPNGPLTRLTLDPAIDSRPKWSPDGRDIWFQTQRGVPDGGYALFRRRADGADQPVRFPTPGRAAHEPEPSPDGEWMVVRVGGLAARGGSGRDIVAYRTNGDSTEVPLLTTGYDEYSPKLSPDGRWLAYVSTESGRPEVYVKPFPNTNDARFAISTSGGIQPLWKGDGSELYYVSAPAAGQQNSGRRMMVAKVDTRTGFSVQSRGELFTLPEGVLGGATWEPVIDVSGDGERFVMLRGISAGEVRRSYKLVIVENFQEELIGRVGN